MSATKNEFAGLVRKLEMTVARQKATLADTEMQLEAVRNQFVLREAELAKGSKK